MTSFGEPHRFAQVHGVVSTFDEIGGWGNLRLDDTTELYFHCTAIADGSRTIPVGVRAQARCAPVGIGTWEVIDVTTVASPRSQSSL